MSRRKTLLMMVLKSFIIIILLVFSLSLSYIGITLSHLFFKEDYYGLPVKNKQLPLHVKFQSTKNEINSFNDLKGYYLYIFFGYTACKSICPIQMRKLSQLDKKVNDKNIKYIFITVDKENDTVESMKYYISNYGEKFIGLSVNGSKDENEVYRFFSIYTSRNSLNKDFNDTINHSSNIYFLSPDMKLQLIYPFGFDNVDKMIKDIQVIKDENSYF